MKFKIFQSTAHMVIIDVECSWFRDIKNKHIGMFPDNFRVMYSDCDHSLWYKTKVYTNESILEKDWTTFLKTLPDNDDINMFLIRDIWTENDYDHEPVNA